MDVLAWSILQFTQTLNTNLKVESVEDELALSHSAVQNLTTQGLSHALRFVQLATLSRDVSIEVGDVLDFEQVTYPKVFFLNVDQFFFAWQTAIRETKSPLVRQSVSFSQTATTTKAKGANNTLVLVQSVGLAYSRSFPVTTNLALSSQVVGYLPSKYWTSFPITVVEP